MGQRMNSFHQGKSGEEHFHNHQCGATEAGRSRKKNTNFLAFRQHDVKLWNELLEVIFLDFCFGTTRPYCWVEHRISSFVLVNLVKLPCRLESRAYRKPSSLCVIFSNVQNYLPEVVHHGDFSSIWNTVDCWCWGDASLKWIFIVTSCRGGDLNRTVWEEKVNQFCSGCYRASY